MDKVKRILEKRLKAVGESMSMSKLTEYVSIDRNLRDKIVSTDRKRLKNLKNSLFDFIHTNPLDYKGLVFKIGYDVMEKKAFVLVDNLNKILPTEEDVKYSQEEINLEKAREDILETLLIDLVDVVEGVGFQVVLLEKSENNSRLFFDVSF